MSVVGGEPAKGRPSNKLGRYELITQIGHGGMAEVQLALQLIAQTASDKFEPEKYTDSVKERVLEAIERKVGGQEIQLASPEPQAQVIDLMEALKASLAAPAAQASSAPAAASPESPGGVGTAHPERRAREEGPESKDEPPGNEERRPAHRARGEDGEPVKKSSSRK